MDIFEKLFQKFVQREMFSHKEKPGLLHLKNISKYLDVFANTFVNASASVQTVASREYVGLYGTRLFLPEKIEIFDDLKLNKMLYQNLILQSLAVHQLKIFGPTDTLSSLGERLHILKCSDQINLYLDQQFSGYSTFQGDLLKKVEEQVTPSGIYPKKVFEFWRLRATARGPLSLSVEDLIKGARKKDQIPDFLFLTVPSLARSRTMMFADESQGQDPRQNPSQVETQLEKSYSAINQNVDLEKEEANPVMHSFEKLETADEYEGGRRVDSGDDELSSHAKALDELNLNKVTRGGEAAKSVFNAEASFEFDLRVQPLEKTAEAGRFNYPEWNYKNNVYMFDHCQLIENPLKMDKQVGKFREELLSKKRFQIKHWQSRIQSLFSEPLWIKKLTEGDEIDIDQVIRDMGELRARKDVAARWYSKRKKQFNDLEIVILFDQSHSSDAWLCNRRVLDTTLESVGTAGLLFEELLPAVTVAGVWSSTRRNCSFQVYKHRDEAWQSFFAKADAIQAQGYTRLGPSIRHATEILNKSRHKKKLILLLTDGKPTDIDGYEGRAGISDVAQACREAEANGILHYALILDNKQKMHFSRMFKHYILLHDPKLLPEELFKILFRLVRK